MKRTCSLLAGVVLGTALLAMPTGARAEDAPTTDKAADAKAAPVDSDKLKAALPEKLGEMKRISSEGTQMKTGDAHMSSARGEYNVDPDKDDVASGSINLIDYGDPAAAKGVVGGDMEFDLKTDSGFQRTVKIDGQPAMQTYNIPDKTGNITIAIGEKVILMADFRNVSAEEFKKLCEQLPVKPVLALVKK